MICYVLRIYLDIIILWISHCYLFLILYTPLVILVSDEIWCLLNDTLIVSSHAITVWLIRYLMPFLLSINCFNYKSFYTVIELINFGKSYKCWIEFWGCILWRFAMLIYLKTWNVVRHKFQLFFTWDNLNFKMMQTATYLLLLIYILLFT